MQYGEFVLIMLMLKKYNLYLDSLCTVEAEDTEWYYSMNHLCLQAGEETIIQSLQSHFSRVEHGEYL